MNVLSDEREAQLRDMGLLSRCQEREVWESHAALRTQVSALRQEAATLTQANQVAWLVEWGHRNGERTYLGFAGTYGAGSETAEGGFEWQFQETAIRFARKDDAVRCLAAIRDLVDRIPHRDGLRGLRSGDSPVPEIHDHVWIMNDEWRRAGTRDEELAAARQEAETLRGQLNAAARFQDELMRNGASPVSRSGYVTLSISEESWQGMLSRAAARVAAPRETNDADSR